jgi:sulfur-carrier protein adenylyltransferase/sulfurtransferase
MLAGKGFTNIYNLSGGIKGFDGAAAVGSPELGLSLFEGKESGPEALLAAFGLETGLRDFYATQEEKANKPEVKALFNKLGGIEVKHQDRIVTEYNRLTGQAATRETLEAQTSGPALEGGLTTEEYMDLFNPDLESVVDIVSIAISIEGQAMDLYMRAAAKSSDDEGRRMLTQMADEEKTHMALLGDLLDEVIGQS